MKTCRRCGKEKNPSEFRLNRRMRDVLSSWCAACHREVTRRWRADHRDEINEPRRVVPRFVYDPASRRTVPNPSPQPKSKSKVR